MNPLQHILVLGLKTYRCFLSPVKNALFGPLGRCRFTPTCSAYTIGAVRGHGAVRGSWLGVLRLCRCHPWGDCGWDPVPEAKQPSKKSKHRDPHSTNLEASSANVH